MELRRLSESYSSLDRGWKACLLAASILLVELLAVAI